MAITYVSTANGTAGDNASVTPPLPTGWQAGDAHLIFASIRNSGTGTVDDHADYTTLHTFGTVKLMGRIAQAGDTAPTVTYSGGVAGATTIAQIVGLRGATLDVTVAELLNASAQNIAYPALDVPGDGQAVLLLAWKQDDSGSISTPAGFTAANTVISTTGDDALQTIRYQIQTTEADISSGSLTVTGGAAAISRALMVAIAPPTLTATAVPGAEPPRVDLTLSWAGASEITVQRVDPDGRTRPVRLAEPATLTAGAWTGSDYETWFGETTLYQATNGVSTYDAASAITLDVDVAWLRHPGQPTLSQQVDVQGDGEPVRRVNRAIHEPLGRRYPIAITDGRRKAKQSTITLRTQTLEDADALIALVDDTAVLLLDVPPAWGWGITHQYMSLGDLTETRTTGANRGAWVPVRHWTADYIVVDRIPDTVEADRTWATVLTEAATWADLLDMYDTWNDVLTGNTS